MEEEPPWAGDPLQEHPLPVEEEPQAPESPPPPPPVSHIYVKERGTGVFIPFAVFPESHQPEDHGVLAPDMAVLRIELSPEAAAVLVFSGVNCLRGFVDEEIKALREMKRMDMTAETLTKHLRDR